MSYSADEFSFILAVIGKAVADTLESEGHLALPQLMEKLRLIEQQAEDEAVRGACQEALNILMQKLH
ncbi:hypothetical protein ACR6A7_19740 [Pantoea sp. RRHST58]|uniref:hypothetical protein n=1 Tax=Pantoea sp. RRHST58 TaxID=3425183 RepID=UPI003DA07849